MLRNRAGGPRRLKRTRIRYLEDGIRMLQDIAIVSWNALLGRYAKQVEQIHCPRLAK